MSIIVVARSAALPVPATPAERAACAWCGAPVWLGYAVRIDAPFGTPECAPCVLPTLAPDDTLEVTAEVRRELLDWMRRRGRGA